MQEDKRYLSQIDNNGNQIDILMELTSHPKI